MLALRTQLNPAFKIAQPLPKLAGDLTAIRNGAGRCFIPGPRRGGLGELRFLAAAPNRQPLGEGGKPQQ
jgi:hypothetical protein